MKPLVFPKNAKPVEWRVEGVESFSHALQLVQAYKSVYRLDNEPRIQFIGTFKWEGYRGGEHNTYEIAELTHTSARWLRQAARHLRKSTLGLTYRHPFTLVIGG